MDIKLKCHLAIEFGLLKGSVYTFGVIAIVVTVSTNSKAFLPSSFKGISDNHGQLHLQLARKDAALQYHAFGYNQKGNQENGRIRLLFLGWNISSAIQIIWHVTYFESRSL